MRTALQKPTLPLAKSAAKASGTVSFHKALAFLPIGLVVLGTAYLGIFLLISPIGFLNDPATLIKTIFPPARRAMLSFPVPLQEARHECRSLSANEFRQAGDIYPAAGEGSPTAL
jgi:hypothetical protein